MLKEMTIFGERDKVQNAIDLLKEFEPIATSMHPDGYYLCYSGGKDSDTLLQSAIEAGVKFTAHYNITTADPKEVIFHIKKVRERLKTQSIKLYMEPPPKFTTGKFKGQRKTMEKLIIHKGMPPTRTVRYCCSEFKEHGGSGRLCLTGVRWAESTRRKSRRPMEIVASKRSDSKLFNDNDEGRMQFENCMQKGKRIINPLVSWTDDDVWTFLRDRKVEYCELYNQGEARIGCIGCPMGGTEGMERDFERFPYAKKMYIKAFDEMIEHKKERGHELQSNWKTGSDVFEWWVHGTDKEQSKIIEGQIGIEQTF